MATQDLNRAGDTTGDGLTAIAKPATNKIVDIVPKNWHRFPGVQAASPRVYVPVFTYSGATFGDDVDVATANVLIDDRAIGVYSPRNQTEKSAALGAANPLAIDVSRPRGWIDISQPYQGNATAPIAPVITSLTPSTAVSVTGAELVVTILGTGFTRFSTVTSGGFPIPSKYIDATHISIYQNPRVAVAGTVQVVVSDHDLNSNASNFVFT